MDQAPIPAEDDFIRATEASQQEDVSEDNTERKLSLGELHDQERFPRYIGEVITPNSKYL